MRSEAVIGRLRLRLAGSSPDQATAWRLRVGCWLDSLSLHVGGMPSSAMLLVRDLSALPPLPSRRGPTPAWEAAVQQRLAQLYRSAARPAHGPVPPHAPSVCFDDPAELLGCLTRDALDGRLWQRWYWQQLCRGYPRAPAPLLAEAWCEHATALPAALAQLAPPTILAALRAFSPRETGRVAHALHARFALPPTVLRLSLADATPPRAGELPSSVAEADPPWRPWLPVVPPDLPPQATYLWGLSRALHHAPAFARSEPFAARAAVWLSVALAMSPLWSGAPSLPPPPVRGAARAQDGTRPPPAAFSNLPPSEAEEEPGRDAGNRNGPNGTLHPAVPARHVEQTLDAETQPLPGAARAQRAESPPPTPLLLPDATRVASDDPPVEAVGASALPREGVPTEWGGVLYLIHLLRWLDLPGGWDESGGLAEHLSGWAIVEALARGLLAEAHEAPNADPIWSVLATLDGRAAGEPAGGALPPLGPFRLPPAWLRRLAPTAPTWRASTSGGALRLTDADVGYPVAEVPLQLLPPGSRGWGAFGQASAYADAPPGSANRATPERLLPDERLACELEWYRARGVAASAVWGEPLPLPRLAPATEAALSPALASWLVRVLGIVRHTLARALRVPPQDVAETLLRAAGRLRVSRTHLDLHLPLDAIRLPVRRAGLDRDPGWVPDLGYIVLFHFE